jgi:hypothetical protein
MKILNVLPPKSHATGFAGNSAIIDMSKYSRVVFIVLTGASSTSNSVVEIEALDGLTSGANKTDIAFKYKYCAGTNDILGNLTDAPATGFAMVASKANSFYAIEVKASDIASVGAAYKAVRLKATADTSNAQLVAVVAICYESGSDYGETLPAVQYAST